MAHNYDSSSYYSCESEDEESRRESENEEESFYCYSCDLRFGSSQALQNHYSQSSRHNYYRDCDQSFGSSQALQNHSQSTRRNCESEDEESSKESKEQALQNHYSQSSRHNCESKDEESSKESKDEVESFYCDSCDRSFGSSQALQNHYLQSSRHNCRDCDRSFGSWQALQSHYSQSSHHNYCRDCDRHFRNTNDLRIHCASKLHQNPFISCPVCQCGFVSAAAITKHVEKSNCFKLSNKKILNKVRDWEQKSGNPNLITLPRVGWYNNIDDFIGAKRYATKASFDGQSYVCPICDKGFRKLPSLNQHLNSNVHEEMWEEIQRTFSTGGTRRIRSMWHHDGWENQEHC